MLFKYSGNKNKIIPKLRPFTAHKRAVELYLGSGAFLLSSTAPGLGIDINSDIVDLWNWLKTTTVDRLKELEALREKKVQETPDGKPDVRDMKLLRGEELYMRVNVTGVYSGQLSSWKLYPQHKLPVEKTAACLERIRNIEIKLGSAHKDYVEEGGDLVFLDPPYLKTKANYKQNGKKGIEESYNPQDTVDLISCIKSPIIFTYGTDAPQTFPQYKWEEVLRKKVPLIRKGGTIERIEHVTYINWRT